MIVIWMYRFMAKINFEAKIKEHNKASSNSNLNKLVLSCLEYLIMESHSNGSEDILKILLRASTEIGETIINNTNTDSNDILFIKNLLQN